MFATFLGACSLLPASLSYKIAVCCGSKTERRSLKLGIGNNNLKTAANVPADY